MIGTLSKVLSFASVATLTSSNKQKFWHTLDKAAAAAAIVPCLTPSTGFANHHFLVTSLREPRTWNMCGPVPSHWSRVSHQQEEKHQKTAGSRWGKKNNKKRRKMRGTICCSVPLHTANHASGHVSKAPGSSKDWYCSECFHGQGTNRQGTASSKLIWQKSTASVPLLFGLMNLISKGIKTQPPKQLKVSAGNLQLQRSLQIRGLELQKCKRKEKKGLL